MMLEMTILPGEAGDMRLVPESGISSAPGSCCHARGLLAEDECAEGNGHPWFSSSRVASWRLVLVMVTPHLN